MRLVATAVAKRAWWQQWLWRGWTTEVEGMARAAVGQQGQRGRQKSAGQVRCCWWRWRQWWWQARADADGQGMRATGDDHGRRGRTLLGKGREPAVMTMAGKGGRWRARDKSPRNNDIRQGRWWARDKSQHGGDRFNFLLGEVRRNCLENILE